MKAPTVVIVLSVLAALAGTRCSSAQPRTAQCQSARLCFAKGARSAAGSRVQIDLYSRAIQLAGERSAVTITARFRRGEAYLKATRGVRVEMSPGVYAVVAPKAEAKRRYWKSCVRDMNDSAIRYRRALLNVRGAAQARNRQVVTEAYELRGECLLELGQREAVIQSYEAGLRYASRKMRAYLLNLAGYALLPTDQRTRAERYFKHAIRADKSIRAAYLNLGIVRIKGRNFRGAKQILTQAIRRWPRSGVAFRLRGIAHNKSGARQAALRDWKRAAALGDGFARRKLKQYRGGGTR